MKRTLDNGAATGQPAGTIHEAARAANPRGRRAAPLHRLAIAPAARYAALRRLCLVALTFAFAQNANAQENHQISAVLKDRFGLAEAKALKIADAVTSAAYRYSLSPALLLAIIQIESRFDERARGPNGATGLMQVVPSVHKLRLVGRKDLRDAATNVDIGSAILRTYVKANEGDVQAALKNYGGSRHYVEKVMALAAKLALRPEFQAQAPLP